MGKYCFGVDVGGTTVKIGMFDKEGDLLNKWEIPTNKENGGTQILPDISASVLDQMREHKIERREVIGVGIGVPGPVDERGVIHNAVNLGWGEFNLSQKLSELTGFLCKAGNDANVAALGEMWKGGGRGFRNLVVVTLGTGVGGGIIANGQMVHGYLGAGGEIGHIHVEDKESEICGCGNRGCLEQYASATGIVRLAKQKLGDTTDDTALRDVEITAKSVFDAVADGDKVAVEIAEQFGYYLGKGLAAVGCVTNPEAFVIGGGVSKAGTGLFDFIEKNYQKFAFPGCRNAKFVLAKLGNDAGIYGAAKLIMDA